jgi:hypothetical protein
MDQRQHVVKQPKNPPPKGYWEAMKSLDRLFDKLFVLKVLSDSSYQTAFDYLLDEKYSRSYVKRIRSR